MQTLLRLARMRPQCLDADFLLGKLVGIADESVDDDASPAVVDTELRSEEHTSELQSLMRISYAVFCLKKKKITITHRINASVTTRTTPQLLTQQPTKQKRI